MTQLVTALKQYMNGETIKSFGSVDKQIRQHNLYTGRLGRLFNDGHGFLTFAQIDDSGNLYVNSTLLSNKERKDIEANITGVIFSELCYPDYYEYDLISVLKKEEIKKKRYEEFMKQFEAESV
jgi:hypothetical protein